MAISPGKYNPLKPDIELFDYKSKKRFGLKLDGQGGLQVGTISQDDTVHIRTQGKKVGDFDEQRSWKGGRGIENLSSNPAGYYDARNAWTLSDEHLYPTLQWEFAKGLRSSDFYMPNPDRSMGWKVLRGDSDRFVSMAFVPETSYTAQYIRLWIKKVGVPGDITVRLSSNSGGLPDTTLASAVITEAEVADFISVLVEFNIAGTAITAGTTYHIVAICETTDDKNNHWKVGVDRETAGSNESNNGSSWTAATYSMYHFIADQDVKRRFFTFVLDGAFYVVDSKDDGSTASELFINGDRGKANSATADTLTDGGKAWITDVWAGAFIKIVRGVGTGQVREIESNTSDDITVTEDWDVTPTSTSEYIIYGTNRFTELSSPGLAVVSSQPIVVNQIVYFPQGTTNIHRMVWVPSTASHAYSADGTNKAHFMLATTSPDGIRIWRGINGTTVGEAKTISYATAAAYGNPPTALTFSTATNIGDATTFITNLIEKDAMLYVLKEDSLYNVTVNGTRVVIVKLQSGMEKTTAPENGAAAIVHQQFMYYSWLHSVIRVYGSSHDDIGQDWSGWGLPDGREGVFSSFDSYTSLLMAGVDAGSGVSSVLAWDGIGWHEIFRAYDNNKRIRTVKVQVCYDTRNRTWIDVGGDLVFQIMPLKKGSPRLDDGVRYHHEAIIESSTLDMGTASALPKFIKELTVYAENLGDQNEIHVDYQVDEDVHTNNWTHATVLYQTPESYAFLGLSNIRKFAYRLRLICGDSSNPPDVLGVIPNGYARVPFKMVWTLRCRADNITSRGRLVKPDELMRWMLDSSRFPGRLEMRSQYQLAHKFFVIIHPPRMFPYKPAQNGQAEESVFTLVLEES